MNVKCFCFGITNPGSAAASYFSPITLAGRSKARVYGQYFVGIAGSNFVGVMDVCFLWVLYVGLVYTVMNLRVP